MSTVTVAIRLMTFEIQPFRGLMPLLLTVVESHRLVVGNPDFRPNGLGMTVRCVIVSQLLKRLITVYSHVQVRHIHCSDVHLDQNLQSF